MRINLIPALAGVGGRFEPYVPLGVLTVAGLARNAGHDVHICDLNLGAVHSITLEAAANAILDGDPELVGFSTMAGSLPRTLLLACRIKDRSSSTVVWLGGPQATGVAQHLRRSLPWIDNVHVGEAGRVTLGAPHTLAQPRLSHSFVPEAAPAYDLIDLARYPSRAFPFEVGRGCPFQCTFCSTSRFFSRDYRMRAPQDIVDGLRALRAIGIDDFEFVHDLFTTSRRDALGVSGALADADLEVNWGCTARSGTINEPDLHVLYRGGCRRIFIGLESGDEGVRRAIGKHTPIANDDRLVRYANSLGIQVTTSFIIGFPEEDGDAVQRTIDWALALDDAGVHVQLHRLAPLAGTVYSSGQYPIVLAAFASDIAGGLLVGDEEINLIARYPDLFPEHHRVVTPLIDPDEVDLIIRLFKRYRRREPYYEESNGREGTHLEAAASQVAATPQG